MIMDKVANLALYRGLGRHIDTAIDFLLKTDLSALPDGRRDVDGDNVFVLMQSPVFKKENKWEAHQRYIDIQIALMPGETILWAPLDSLNGWTPYDAKGDFTLSEDAAPGTALPMAPETFCLFFPGDAHKPGLGEGSGRKAVVKVRVD